MAIAQPTATDPLSSPDHSALHRIAVFHILLLLCLELGTSLNGDQ